MKDLARPAFEIKRRYIFSLLSLTSTTDLSWPLLTSVFSAFEPRANDNAFTINDFPAPVSPVITVKPSKKGSSNSRIIAKSFI